MWIHTGLAAIPEVLRTTKRHQKIRSPHTRSHKQLLHMWWSRHTRHQSVVFPPSLPVRHIQSSPEITKTPNKPSNNKIKKETPICYLNSQRLEAINTKLVLHFACVLRIILDQMAGSAPWASQWQLPLHSYRAGLLPSGQGCTPDILLISPS